MTVMRMAMICTLTVGVLIAAAIGFALIVKMDFHATATGRVEPARVLPIRVEASGKIERLAKPGLVEAGDVLVALSDTGSRTQLALVQDTIRLLEGELAKEQGRLGNPQRRFQLTQDLKAQQRQAETLAKDIRNKTITAPFSGRVLLSLIHI